MSFFVLVNEAHSAFSKAGGSLDELGVDNHFEARASAFRLVAPGGHRVTAQRLETPNGDFIIALGSLIHAGRPPPDCLPTLLDSFSPDTFDWSDLLGTHVLLVRKAGTLYVATDGLGACKLYHNADRTLWSNSFLAMCELERPRRLDPQACYEYVFNGSVFGRRTLAQGISALPANSILAVGESIQVIQRPSPIIEEDTAPGSSLDAIADRHISQLDRVFGPIAACHGDRLRLSFSGGFDSRLMLAMLLRHDVRPTLFVYGDGDDEDVRIARLICAAEGLELECIDKFTPPPEPDAFPELVEQDLIAFDGWKVEQGLFDFGVDRLDRERRHVGGQVPLNGSLGEIYRNFFYMPDRPAGTGAVISTFYSRYDPHSLTDRFDEQGYRAAMAESMREAVGSNGDALRRDQVEALYPRFRGRFWTGRDAQVNQRFGTMFFPYLEPAAISNTARIPIRHKDLGRLQGRMIGRINRRLGDYPSDYGFQLDGPRPLSYRVKSLISTQRPAALRKLSFRLQHRQPEPRPPGLTRPYLERVIDPEFPVMRGLFHPERVHSAQQYAMMAAIEYLARRFDMDLPPPGE
jgi:asparagine synthase (glutamine-hydrolysing)